ncbi:MAG: DsbA family protein [Actinomycetota bacterium]|nr:DsbA family protein [Actinomycetota bacterium]
MRARLTCYYDYTCPYSNRVFHWLDQVGAEASGPEVTWAPFSLAEVKREAGSASPLEDPELGTTSVLALALGCAARQADFDRYHRSTFAAMHDADQRPGPDELLQLASEAGVEVDAFMAQRDTWRRAVETDHRAGVGRWQVFGTPTLVIDEEEAVFLKLGSVPRPEESFELWRSLHTLSVSHPELVEMKRPS